MPGRLTDQAAVAVALARNVAGGAEPTVAHLLVGLVTEPEGRAGRRLRERASAAAALIERAGSTPAPPLAGALQRAVLAAGRRAATTVDLLDAATAGGGSDVEDLLAGAGYHRDLDGWLTGDPDEDWFEDPETYGLNPDGDNVLDRAAARVVAQVRAVGGGAVEVLIAATAAPDAGVDGPDPRDLAAVAARLNRNRDRSADERWDTGLQAVITAAETLHEGAAVTVRDLLRASLVAGGDGPRLILELATKTS